MISQTVWILHGKGGSPDGSSRQLQQCLERLCEGRDVSFYRPRLLHSAPEVLAEDSLAELRTREIPHGAVLVGISLGGLVAASLQEDSRADLHVICISSPTWADGVRIKKPMPNRFAIYSSGDEVIAGRTAEWPQLSFALDLPWLSHDTDRHKEPLSELVFAYISEGSAAVEKLCVKRDPLR